jgi:phosphatidylinositol glycan class B
MHISKCFGNSVESILYLVAFNYYLKITKHFDNNIMIFTFIITVAFMIRCTSPIGFVLLIIYKIYSEDCLKTLIKAAASVAVPTIIFLTAMDSYYYQQFTFVPYNFLKKNIVEHISEYFGVSPTHTYLSTTIPNGLNYMLVLLVFTVGYNVDIIRKDYSCSQLFVLAITYLGVFSLVPHKEDRFILPIFPFLFLLMG